MRKSIFMLCLVALLVSCGGDVKKELSMKPQSTVVKGALGDCYEVVEKDYPVKDEGMYDIVYIELKRTSAPPPFDVDKATTFSITSKDKPIQVGFGIEVLDKDGYVIEVKQANQGGLSGVYSSDDVEAAMQLKANETCVVRWAINASEDIKPVQFKITSAIGGKVSDTKASNGNDWDKVLDEYETFIDSYVKLIKKAAEGDTNALAEYEKVLSKAETLESKLSNAESSMTSAQLSRFSKLQNKLLELVTI